MGMGGNRVLRDGTGASMLARFDRDVLSQPGVKWLIVLESINDIGRAGKRFAKRSTTGFAPVEPMTASSISKPPREIATTPSGCGRSSIRATTCT